MGQGADLQRRGRVARSDGHQDVEGEDFARSTCRACLAALRWGAARMIDDFVIDADPGGSPRVDPRVAAGADDVGDAEGGDELPQVPIVRRIVSGAEPGVERGALDAAIELEIDFGGWTRLDRGDGESEVPEAYADRMREAFRPGAWEPARLNARDSDGILIVARGGSDWVGDSAGVEQARRLAVGLRRPRFLLVLGAGAEAGAPLEASPQAVGELSLWLRRERIVTLCVLWAGDRGGADLEEAARDLLVSVLKS